MRIKFVTLNLLEGGIFFDNIERFLTEERPDVMTFQEVYNGADATLEKRFRTMEVLSSIFPSYHASFAAAFNDIDHGGVESGNAILSRFPITSAGHAFFDVPYDPAYRKELRNGDYSHDPQVIQTVQLDAEGKTLHIGNVHGIWNTDGNDNPRRLAMSKTIVEQMRGKSPAILAGDFNVQPETETIGNIEKHMTNVFKGQLTSTFNMRHKTNPGYATAVVDMVFVSPDVQVVSNHLSEADVSDHKALVCEFEI
jgi:endonuclease/exonuclease/phosphatase family metal-dependent hydrolase